MAVRLVVESPRPITRVARDLGVNAESLRKWTRGPRQMGRRRRPGEQATGKTDRGWTSIEEVFERGGDRLVRHRIYDPRGEVLHETFRP